MDAKNLQDKQNEAGITDELLAKNPEEYHEKMKQFLADNENNHDHILAKNVTETCGKVFSYKELPREDVEAAVLAIDALLECFNKLIDKKD